MDLRERIVEDTKAALRAGKEVRLVTLRMLSSSIHNRSIEKRAKGEPDALSEDEILGVIRSEAKKRRDSIIEFEKGGRKDLVEKEEAELLILSEYLPAEVDDAAVENAVKESVAELGSVTQKDFGRIMGVAMKRLNGRASGERVSRAVKAYFG